MSHTLETIIERHALARAGAPPARAKGIVLLIHGRGATAESMLPLADVVAQPELCYLAPQADGYTWYPQSFMAPTAANEPGSRVRWTAWRRSSPTFWPPALRRRSSPSSASARAPA